MTQRRSVVVHQTSQRRAAASSTAINRSLIVPAFKGLSEQQGKDERCAIDRTRTRIRTRLSQGRNPEPVGTIRPVSRSFPGDGPAPYRVAKGRPRLLPHSLRRGAALLREYLTENPELLWVSFPLIFKEGANSGGPPDLRGRRQTPRPKRARMKSRVNSSARPPSQKENPSQAAF